MREIESIVNRRAYGELPLDGPSRARVSRGLLRLLAREGQVIAWRAAEALGDWLARVANATASCDRADNASASRDADGAEFAREVVRRLRWSLLDEAGATPWMSAEAMAEIGARNLALIEPHIGAILSHYHDVAPRGAIWTAGRIGPLRPEWFAGFIPDLAAALDSPDPTIRGHAAWALGRLGAHSSEAPLRALATDAARLRFYRDGDLAPATVCALAAEALSAEALSALAREKTSQIER